MQIKIIDFDKAVDCNAKLLDLAMTAVTLIKMVNKNPVSSPSPVSAISEVMVADKANWQSGIEASVQVDSEWPALASRLLATVYKVFGLLNMVSTEVAYLTITRRN
jgi:hypothetical protein